jgi:hypothetical protein
MFALRVVLGAVGAVLCAWFVLGLIQTHDQTQVNTLVTDHSRLSFAQARAAQKSLNEGETLNPDESLASLRALVQTRAGQTRKAIATALAVARAHGQDINAWLVLEYLVSGGVDPPLYRLAAARTAVLAPPVRAHS